MRCQARCDAQGAAKLLLAKGLADFGFAGSPINEGPARELAAGSFLIQQRNTVLAGAPGAGKSRLAVAIAHRCIRADALTRLDLVVLDERGYLPFAQSVAQSGGQPLFTWSAGFTGAPPWRWPPTSASPKGRRCSGTPKWPQPCPTGSRPIATSIFIRHDHTKGLAALLKLMPLNQRD